MFSVITIEDEVSSFNPFVDRRLSNAQVLLDPLCMGVSRSFSYDERPQIEKWTVSQLKKPLADSFSSG